MSDDAAERRGELREAWEKQSAGWGRQADRVRQDGMAVSAWMIDHARLQPGQRVLELAAGPGDTGFLAAELIRPGGTLISSDGSEGMLELARTRARLQGIENVEFKQLELEWIDEPAASFDVVLCRWGVMLALDPAAALAEFRRVLRPGGRLALAVWDDPAANPAMTLLPGLLARLGLVDPPNGSPPPGPGPFALSAPGELAERLSAAGFTDVLVEPVAIERTYQSVTDWLGESVDLSMTFSSTWRDLDSSQRQVVQREAERLAERFTRADGSLVMPGRSLGGAAEA